MSLKYRTLFSVFQCIKRVHCTYIHVIISIYMLGSESHRHSVEWKMIRDVEKESMRLFPQSQRGGIGSEGTILRIHFNN